MFAPVIIPTLNRHEHLRRCVESLKRNSLAKETELFISVDFPPSEKYEEGYKKVIDYVKNQSGSGFRNVYVYYQEQNLGPEGNSRFLRNEVFKSYDRFILTEDDNEFSPNFLEYVNKGLDLFEKDDDILFIAGYKSNYAWEFKDNNIAKIQKFPAWGYGTWKDKYKRMYEWINRDKFIGLMKDRAFCKKIYLSQYEIFYTLIQALLANPDDKSSVYINQYKDIRCIDYTAAIYMVACGKYAVIPQISLVKNWGYDGSGINCGNVEGRNYYDVVIDNRDSYEYTMSEDFKYSAINNECKEIQYREKLNIARFYRFIMCTFGIPTARKLNNLCYKLKSKYTM